ncbi:mitochondrial carrier domain-containing protein [Suillus discolor]|uniref:Mitochondrial carrier domain-containing protein n=1 Tax=Suillus discolor TaxID=1912936 RepID=A0A9P7FHG3_9AGAM|nr:mitochondrial carrier domain-containing protein [Suillus discolor]KAG2117970.1 mitochondrial carrier domain-containing protein [Suillus discolor]
MASSTIPPPLSMLESFLCGGLAGCIAVTVSNPAEVAKTRLQLQGELVKGGGKRVYKDVLDVLAKTWRNEGIRGLQRGLGPAYVYQILLNGSRLGFYEPFRRTINRSIGRSITDQIPFTSAVAGAASGIIGASLGNPLFLIKARMQAYSPILPVGTQHYYKSSFDALVTIFRTEKFWGLLRGMDAAILRTAMGSSVQLPTYKWTKNQLGSHGLLPSNSILTYLVSSSVSGVCVCIVMQPADTALTRVYNQPTTRTPDGRLSGMLYRNPIDCLWKTFRTEGVFGWYKGSTAQFLRVAPHTIITLTVNDIILGLYKDIRNRRS